MGGLRNAKLAMNVIRNLGSKMLTQSCRNPVLEANNNYQLKHQCFSVNSPSIRSKFNSFYPFGRQTHKGRSFLSSTGASRFHHSSASHQNRIPPGRRWILIRVLVGGYFITRWGLEFSEKIPYSERFHVILISKDSERYIGESKFNDVMKKYEGRVLPETHSKSVRVRSIANEIIEALKRGLRYEQVGSGLELQDAKREKESRKRGFKVATHHLEGLKWEIVVVDMPIPTAFSLPGGKIVVFSGLFDLFRTDAEIATVIAHEVGHVVARHGAEDFSKKLWLIDLQAFVGISDEITKPIFEALDYLLRPSSRRNEMEADYIGLLLLASAGYDPRVAPKVYEKFGEFSRRSSLKEDLSKHPSAEKRVKALSQAKVMAEALSIYNESRSNILLEMMRMWVI